MAIAPRRGHVDKPLAILLAVILVGGGLMFASAAFGLLARGHGNMSSVFFNHLVLGMGLGAGLLVAAASIDYAFWRRIAPYLFIAAVIATALVFAPVIGLEHGGGRRWLLIFGQSFQPSELLKIASIIMAAAYFAAHRAKIGSLRYGLGGLGAILAAPVLLLVLQPDLGTLGVIGASVCAVFLAAGARPRDIGILITTILIVGATLIATLDHARARVTTFLNPAANQQGSSYQIKQSLIAIGSGGAFGRGFGQGVQKFTYLPEPMGDSIFAVAGEELGFVGTVIIVFGFLAFTLRGLRVGAHAPDPFGALLAIGIATYLGGEAFINMAAMLSIAPLTGIPLTFVSQGGSAMLISLASAGILLSVSRRAGKRTAAALPR